MSLVPTTTAARLTLLLTAALACVAAGVVAFEPGRAIVDLGLPSWVVTVGLLISFLLAEQLVMRVEFRRQAHTLTLAALPLAVGVLVAPVGVLVLARFVGAGAALLISRMRPAKLAYNTAAYAFEAAVDGAVTHALLGGGPAQVDLRSATIVVATILVVDQVMSGLVLLVIRLHSGPLSTRDVLEVLVPSSVVALVTSMAGIGALLLGRDGAVGVCVMVVAAFAAAVLYRGYLTTSRRHQSLELVHDFVTVGTGAESFSAAAAQLLPHVRSLLRAGLVQLTVLPTEDSGIAVSMTDGEQGFTTADVSEQELDWPTIRALQTGEPLLAPRSSKDAAIRGWLREHGHRDAMLVPLPSNGTLSGTVLVADRLGETATFTDDDVTLLQTLTGHLSIAGTNARMVERLAYDATHDALTGLANRANLRRRIVDAPGTPSTVMLLDLDRFKEVNDALGHAAGDELLRVVANRLRATLPANATIARLGGDEFAVHVPGLADESQAVALGRSVSAELARPVHVEEALLSAEASIGIALGSGGDASDLLRQADTAMYVAKADDLDVAVFHPDMDRGRVENLALLADLRSTLREQPEQFTVYFQPKIDLAGRTVVSAEALVRWNHPEFGVIPPDRFITLAETSGLMDQFTPVVLDMALREARRWDELGVPVSVAVNMSARNVGDKSLPGRIDAALARTAVPADRLIVEITESSVISEPEQTLGVLNELAALGVCVSLDDFGTGYSSLSYLQRLPAREVKIDKSFVNGLSSPDPESSRALISAITSLCTTLGMQVVAEGAETDAQLDELEQLGCHVAQGYTISAPMAADEFARWLVARRASETPVRLVRAG